MRHLLEVDDLDRNELDDVLARAAATGPWPAALAGRGAALVFEKPSARTRNSMELAVVQLGGHPVTIRGDEVGLGARESVEDVARTLACYHAVVAARVFSHDTVTRMASVGAVPVVNLLSDEGHPMQALADARTLLDEFGSLEGRTVAFVGDGNNVCRSLALVVARLGGHSRIATPPGYALGAADLARIERAGDRPECSDDPVAAVRGAVHAIDGAKGRRTRNSPSAGARRRWKRRGERDPRWAQRCLPGREGARGRGIGGGRCPAWA